MESKRFTAQQTKIALLNARGIARLLDPDGYITSVIGWRDAKEETIYRPPHLVSPKIRARVLRVITGDTFDITLDDLTDLSRVPSPLRRRWRAIRNSGVDYVRVRLIGIHAPDNHDPLPSVQRLAEESAEFLRALIEGQFVRLTFEQEYFDRENILLAYVEIDGHSLQRELLRRGLVSLDTSRPFVFTADFLALESEARVGKIGLWGHEEIASRSGSGMLLSDSGALLASYVGGVTSAVQPVKFEHAVIVNEIYPSPSGEEGEWIELFNPTDLAVSLAGWTLDDVRGGGSRPWIFPADTMVSPHAYMMVSGLQTGLKLNNTGDDVWLVSPDQLISESVTYPRVHAGYSFGRIESGSGSLWCLSDPTPGAGNHCREEAAPGQGRSSSRRVTVARGKSSVLRTRYVRADSLRRDVPGSGFSLPPGLKPLLLQGNVLVSDGDGGETIRRAEYAIFGIGFLGGIVAIVAWGLARFPLLRRKAK